MRAAAWRLLALGLVSFLPCVLCDAQDPAPPPGPGATAFSRGVAAIAARIDAETGARTAAVVFVVEGGLNREQARRVSKTIADTFGGTKIEDDNWLRAGVVALAGSPAVQQRPMGGMPGLESTLGTAFSAGSPDYANTLEAVRTASALVAAETGPRYVVLITQRHADNEDGLVLLPRLLVDDLKVPEDLRFLVEDERFLAVLAEAVEGGVGPESAPTGLLVRGGDQKSHN